MLRVFKDLLRKYLIKGKIFLGFEEPLPWSPSKIGLYGLYSDKVSKSEFKALVYGVGDHEYHTQILAFLLHVYTQEEIRLVQGRLDHDTGGLIMRWMVWEDLLPKGLLYYRTIKELKRDLDEVSGEGE